MLVDEFFKYWVTEINKTLKNDVPFCTNLKCIQTNVYLISNYMYMYLVFVRVMEGKVCV